MRIGRITSPRLPSRARHVLYFALGSPQCLEVLIEGLWVQHMETDRRSKIDESWRRPERLFALLRSDILQDDAETLEAVD